jgi:hypothetical protein
MHLHFSKIFFSAVVKRFFVPSGVQLPETDRVQFHFRHTSFSSQLQCRVGLTLPKVESLRITLNLDGSPITSKSHTHPSPSQTSRLLTSSLSLGVPVPRTTQCM